MGARVNTIRKGDCGVRTKELIARYYLVLMGEFYYSDKRLFLSMDKGDMFHNAITLILQDSKFNALKTDSEIMDRIRRRIRNVISEIKQDHNLYKNKSHANDIQTEEAGSDEPEA
nr:MAG: hypothetical protein [Bacteriophage sp.]